MNSYQSIEQSKTACRAVKTCLITCLYLWLHCAPRPQVTAAPPASDQGFARPNEALKPFTLTCENNPIEFRTWQRKFRVYYTTSSFDKRNLEEQQAYTTNCLDPKLEQRIQAKIETDTPVFGKENSIMKALEDDLLIRFPMFNRRLEFFQCTQSKGQSFTDFCAVL